MNAALLLDHYARIADAPDAIARLRRFVLDLAVRGKLVEQDAGDEPASELLKRIAAEKARLVKAGELRKPRDLDDGEQTPEPFPIPEGWRWIRLDTVGAIIGGGTPSAGDADNFAEPGDGIPWLTPADLGGYSDLYISRGARDLSEKGSRASSATVMPAGSVLFTSRAPIGYVAIAANPLSTNQGFKSIIPYVIDCSRFIALVMKAFAPEIDAKAPGTTFKEVSGKIVAAVSFPLPPLAEQHRIVAKVDELMALCDQLEAARAEREAARDTFTLSTLAKLNTPDPETFGDDARFALANLAPLTTRTEQIKQLRQTILNLAVRGKLVEQAFDDLPVFEGLKQIKGELSFAAPFGWKWVLFSEIAEFKNGDRSAKYPKRSEYVSAGIPWINTGHIQPDGTLSRASMHFISIEKFNSLGGGKIKPGDILYCLRGATFGKTAFVEPYEQGAIASSLMIIRPSPHLDKRYAFIFLTSHLGRQQLKRFDNGTAQPNLSAANVKRYQFPLPPLAEQHRIVAKVDELMALCDQLEASLTTGEQTGSHLLEAVLHNALEPA